MPTSTDNEKDESPRRGSSRGSRPRAVASTLSTETILDLVERFGLVDMVTSKVRERLEAVDLDDMFDELQRYVRRNPEVLVVALATITVSAGLIVYLNARNEGGGQDEADEEVPVRVRAAAPRAASATARTRR